jgi:hypothetical protein
MQAALKPSRVIALDPSPRGFAYVILEVPHYLVDWGVIQAKGAASLKRLEALLARYEPERCIIEDYTAPECRRVQHVKDFLFSLEMLALLRGMGALRVSQSVVRKHFAEAGRNKYEIARALADRFPELRPRLPRVRKPWMSEDERMNIFDALSFALAATTAPYQPNGTIT